MTFRRKILIGAFIAMCVFAFSITAFAAKIGNQPMTTVEDVIAATGVNPVLKKDSLLYVTHDRTNGQTEFKYRRFGDDYKLEDTKTLFTRTSSLKKEQTCGLYPAVSKNYKNSTVPPALVMVDDALDVAYTYPANLFQISKTGDSVTMSEKTPAQAAKTKRHLRPFISALKGGIFAPGQTREIFAALQWYDYEDGYSLVNLDVFNVEGDGEKINFDKSKDFAFTSSGNIFAKMAVGDINGDGYANEIAVFTNVPARSKNSASSSDLWKYYLYVFQVNWKGSAVEINTLVDAKEVYSHEIGKYNTFRDIWFLKAAGDIAIADFNGDGRNEIAVVYKGYNEDLPQGLDSDLTNVMGPVYAKLYQYNASVNGRLVESRTAAKKSFSSLGGWHTDNSDIRTLSDLGDLKIAAADVDGDGKSELAMFGIFWAADFEKNLVVNDTLTKGTWSSQLHLWKYSEPASNTPATDVAARLNMKYDKKLADLGEFYSSKRLAYRTKFLNEDYNTGYDNGGKRQYVAGKTFTEPMFQIISGVFSGTTTTQKPCEDIIVSFSRNISRDINFSSDAYAKGVGKSYIKAFCPVLDNDGKFKEFKSVDIYTGNSGDNITIGLAAGDFVGDGILLKDPYHFYHDGRGVFTSVIQALPYHVDYIPLPWEKDGKPKLANFTFVSGGEVSYVRTTDTKTKNTAKTVSTSTYEMKSKLGLSISFSPTDFIPFVPNPDSKFSPRHSFLFEGRANYTGKDTAQKLEASTETVKTTETIKATAVDSVMAYSVRQHTWRYPIEPVPEWYKVRSKDIPSDGKFAYTVTMTEAPKSHKGRIGYNARHEEGNLFSYPTKMDNIPDFTNAKTKILTEAVDYLLEPGEYKKEVEVTAAKETENSITAEHTTQVGFNFQYMFGNYGIGKSGAKVDTDHQWSWEGSRNNVLNSTFTKGDKLSVTFADPVKAKGMAGIINNVAFSTTYQAYINPNGLMKMGFAVNLQGGGSPVPILWRESVYNVSADPSFVLPNKFAVTKQGIRVNPDKLSATSVRGVELYAMYEGKQLILPAPFFAKGSTYVLSFPIYNASFVDVPSFKVRLSYAPYKDRHDASKFVKIDEVTISTLRGWTQGSEANKTYANFTFTVPDSAAFGDHVFLAEIDPDNAIKEVHEEWSEKIPGGNNTGIFIFPIMDANGNNPNNTSKRIDSSDVKATVKVGRESSVKSSAADDDYDGNFEEYEPLEWIDYESGGKLYNYIMRQSDPVEIRVNLDYIANVEAGLTLFEVVQEVEEDGVSFDEVYYEDSYYVTADTENETDYSFYFIISSEDIKDAKAVRLDITDIDDLTSDDETYTVSIPLIVKGSDNDDGSEDIEEFISGVGSPGSGCNSGLTFYVAALLAVILFAFSTSKSKSR